MKYTFFAQTDPGRARENNEDSVTFDSNTSVGVLADGMGGYNAGEIASGMATVFIKSELSRWLVEVGAQVEPSQMRRAIEICVENANQSILNTAISNPQYSGMGTTLVVAVFLEETLMLGHIGDSRCYRLRDGTLMQLTKDHSLLQEQIDAGLITSAQALLSPNKNLVTRALGVEDSAMLELSEQQVASGDLYLMCSDGLTDMVDDPTIAKILQKRTTLEIMANDLISHANKNGGRDNIAVLLIQAAGALKKRGFISRLLGNSLIHELFGHKF